MADGICALGRLVRTVGGFTDGLRSEPEVPSSELRVEYFPYDPFAERIWELRSPGLAAPPGSPEQARLFFPPGPASSGTDHPAETLDYSDKQQGRDAAEGPQGRC
jgi:hypothetical protein